MSFIRPNDTLRKQQRHPCAPELASFFLLPVSDGLIKDMSSPDRACLLVPRDVPHALTFLGESGDHGVLCPYAQQPRGSLPTCSGGCRPGAPKLEDHPCCAKQPFA